jgi:hypothetical protein
VVTIFYILRRLLSFVFLTGAGRHRVAGSGSDPWKSIPCLLKINGYFQKFLWTTLVFIIIIIVQLINSSVKMFRGMMDKYSRLNYWIGSVSLDGRKRIQSQMDRIRITRLHCSSFRRYRYLFLIWWLGQVFRFYGSPPDPA